MSEDINITIKNFKELESYVLDKCSSVHFVDCAIGDLSKLQSIKGLDLHFINCKDIPLKELCELNLSGLEIKQSSTSGKLEELKNCTFTGLYLNLDIRDYSFLKGLKQLKYLYLNGSNFDDLSCLNENIQVLDISDCIIKDSYPEVNFNKLIRLVMQRIKCNSIDFLHLMPNVEYLNVEGIDKRINPQPLVSMNKLKTYINPDGKIIKKT